MSEINLVIKISEDTVNKIKDNALFFGSIPSDIRWDVANAIVNGTPTKEETSRPHGEWIPYPERLPEETGAYLVTIDYGDGLSCAAVRYFWDEKRLWNEAEEYITAWMPIPKPYKEEGEKE